MTEWRDWVLALPVSEQVQNPKFCRSDELKKRELKEVASEAVSPTKKHARMDSDHVNTDEICSGNTDPIVIQMSDNNAFGLETISSSNPSNLCFSGNVQVDSGDITSESSSQSCTESGFCTSYVTRNDSSKHGMATRFPKIRLKIPKQSEECSSNFSNSPAGIISNKVNDGGCTDDVRGAVKQRVLPSRSAGKSLNKQSGMEKKRDNEGDGKKRNDDLHKLIFLPNGLPDGTSLAYHVKGQKILEGYKKENGIFCNHCSNVISPSQFEAHAGMATRKKPYQHIYDANGFTLHDIAVSLAEGQKNQTAEPSSTDDIISPDFVDSWRRPRSKVIRLDRPSVKKSENDYGGNCVLCSAHDFSVNRFGDRTIILCDQCEKEHHVGCLREAGLCDLKELPKEKWFCCNDCGRIFSSLRDLVARGSEEIPFSETTKINKKLLEKGLCEVADGDVQLRVLNGKCCLPKHQPLLAKVIYLFRKGFNPIISATGRDLIPSMVRGKNVHGQEFGGMYCFVLTVKSVVVSAALLRVCGRELAELPLVATIKKHQGKGYFLALYSCIEKLLGFLKVEKLVLPAAENAKTMWLDRFGFKEMSQEKLSMYTRMFQLTLFRETVVLEKQVEQQKVMTEYERDLTTAFC